MNAKTEKKIIVFLLISIFVIGASIFKDYGISWDERISRSNGFFSLRYIYTLLGIEFNYEFPNFFGPPNQTYKDYVDNVYGVTFDLPLAIIEYFLNIKDPKNYYHLRHFCNFTIFIISIYFFYLTLRKYYVFSLSIIGMFMYILSPRIFAEAFYNSKDLIFLSYFCITTYFATNYFENRNLKNLILLSFFIGLTIGSRILGLLIPVIIFMYILIEYREKNLFKWLKNIIFYLIFTSIFIILLYPFLWENPFNIVKVFSSMSNFNWNGSVFYFGKYEIGKYMPWHYSMIMISITTPLIYLILFLY